MEKIRRNINIKSYQCLNTNKNVKVYDSDNDVWVYNVVQYDIDGNVIFNPYGKIMSNFIINDVNDSNPYNLNQYNFYRNFKNPISYFQAREIYNNVIQYQNFIRYLCTECTIPINNNINEYIDLIDKYYYDDGDFLLRYSSNLIYDKLPTYIPLNINHISFLDYVINAFNNNDDYPFDFTNDYSLNTILGVNNANNFIINYINSSIKIRVLINLMSTYILDNNTVIPNDLRNSNAEITNIVEVYLITLALNYYNTYFNCKFLTIPTFNNYIYSEDSSIVLPILITNNIKDLGITSNAVQEWIPGREYYEGEVVLYRGNSYILRDNSDFPLLVDSNNRKYFTGVKNVRENVIYFDNCNVNSDGYATSFIMIDYNGVVNSDITQNVNFVHWTRNVKNNYVNDPQQYVITNIDSQLQTLRSYRKNNNFYSFFDRNQDNDGGWFKTGVNFNQERLVNDYNGVVRNYRSYISKIYRKITTNNISVFNISTFTNPNFTTLNSNQTQDLINIISLFGFDKDKTGHDFIIYQYIINECSINNVVVDNGITFSEVYHRYKIANNGDDNDYIYDFEEQPFINYNISNSNTVNNLNNENIVNNIYVKGEENMLNYIPQSKQEYELGIAFPPTVISDVNVDRGISYTFSRNFRLNEYKSLEQLITSGFIIKEN